METIVSRLAEVCFVVVSTIETICFCLGNKMFPQKKQIVSVIDVIALHVYFQLVR